MKKNIYTIAIAAALAIASASCSKAYNCHCVYKDNGVVTHEEDYKINEGKKEKTEAKCNSMSYQSSSTVGGNSYVSTTECALN